jgi:phenylacetate-CoA ligase
VTIGATLQARRLRLLVDAEREFYESRAGWSMDDVRAWQVERFNELWSGWIRRIPFYREAFERGGVSTSFRDWNSIREQLPLTGKPELRASGAARVDPSRRVGYVVSTGGTTSEPVSIPSWQSEKARSAARSWLGREWHGIEPSDPLFMIWGHSQLFGRGWIGAWRRLSRAARDRVLGYRRWSAYRLGDDDLRQAARRLIAFAPRYIVGYSVALARFAAVNAELADRFAGLELKAVIATAESFAQSEDRTLVQSVFGAPVVMEYGAVETGPIAYEDPEGVYRIFWRDLLVESVAVDGTGARELVVTTLYPRALPLVRYRLGDLVDCEPTVADGRMTFTRVTGRSNDVISLKNGRRLHSEAFTHVLRDLRGMAAFQVIQDRAGDITIRYEADRSDSRLDREEVMRRLSLLDGSLSAARIERVALLPRTTAGKLKRISSDYRPDRVGSGRTGVVA